MRLTASRLALAERCLGAAVLPGVHAEPTPAQAAGTGRHRFLERAALVGREAALAKIPEGAPWRSTCEAIDLAEIPEGDSEVAYAYDPETDTARRLGTALARDYGAATPGEVTGTADLVVPAVPGGVVLVVDFKGRSEDTPAAEHLQLGFYALAVARAQGVEEVDVALCRVHEDGRLEWDRVSLGAWDLLALADRIATLVARVQAAQGALAAGRLPDLRTGTHCLRCPALTTCPAQAQAAREILRDADAPGAVPAFADQLALLSDADAGAALVRLEQVRAYADAGVAALRERARLRGLPLPDGTRLVPVETTRRTILVDAALPLLRARLGEQADAAVDRSMSVESVRALARQLDAAHPRRAGDQILRELEAAGALRTATYTQLRVRPAAPATTTTTTETET